MAESTELIIEIRTNNPAIKKGDEMKRKML
jgi:hypothetical protein